MELWAIWAVAVVVLAILEIFTAGFFSLCLAFGALCASVGAACGAGAGWQWALFAAGSLAAFIFVRPLAMKSVSKHDRIKTGVDALVGRTARVTEAIDPVAGTGRVAIDGDDWRAEADEAIAVGQTVTIEKVESATLIVKNNS